MRFVDAHCHFEHAVFDGERERILSACADEGISALVVPATHAADWPKVQSVACEHENLYYGLGLHPWWAETHSESDLRALEEALKVRHPRCVGIGECGLDRVRGSIAAQEPWFEAQVRLARDYDYPLMLHSVRSHEAVMAVMKRVGYQGRGLLHGFAGSYQQGVQLVDRGLCIGVTGVITYARARKTRAAIARLPLAALVLETDAPDMPPVGIPKGGNSPLLLTRIFQALTELRPESPQEIAEQLLENVRQLYGVAV